MEKMKLKSWEFRKDRRGSMIYTSLGVVVVLIVTCIAMHLMNSSYTKTAKHAEQVKMTSTILGVKGQLPTILDHTGHPAVWKVGHYMTDDGVNKYLTMGSRDAGRNAMIRDMQIDIAREFNEQLCKTSDRCMGGNEFIWSINDIDIRMKGIEPDDVEIAESDDGTGNIVLIVTIPEMSSSYRDITYNETGYKTAAVVPVRLFKLYDKAYDFHQSYNENVQWSTTIALYMRAYVNGYNPKHNGSFIKEGHISFDPIDQVMRGDLESIKAIGEDPAALTDIGSVPIATWLSEWTYLGEPSFLPPGLDLDAGDIDADEIVDTLAKGYDIESASNCSSLTNSDEREECEKFNDPDVLEEKADELKEERENLEELARDIQDWENSVDTDMTCDDFTESSEEIIDNAIHDFRRDRAEEVIIGPSMDYATGTELEDEVDKNNDEVRYVWLAVEELINIKDNRLPLIENNPCRLDDDEDCRPCPDGPDDCDDPDCDRIRCPSCNDDTDCECEQYKTGSRSEKVDCEKEVCKGDGDEETCETKEWTESVRVDECNCQCHPTDTLIDNIADQLDVIKERIEARKERLKEQEEETRERAEDLREAEKKLEEIKNLKNKQVDDGFDVAGKIDFVYVKYDDGVNKMCYNYPTWKERVNGTCGDKLESTALYTGQIAAASICCALTGGCCPAVKYATEWFPAMYQVEGKYNITETVIDDKNRVILHNLGSSDGSLYGKPGDPQLYTYAAGEFRIYEDYEITAATRTGNRVLVYLYLPRIAQSQGLSGALNNVLESFTDDSCKGDVC